MREIPSLAKQHAFVRSLDTVSISSVPEEMHSDENKSDVEGIITGKETTSSIFGGKFRVVQRICQVGGDAVPTTVVEVVELAREGAEAKRKNETLSEQNTNIGA